MNLAKGIIVTYNTWVTSTHVWWIIKQFEYLISKNPQNSKFNFTMFLRKIIYKNFSISKFNKICAEATKVLQNGRNFFFSFIISCMILFCNLFNFFD
jgi:hypothetical protein